MTDPPRAIDALVARLDACYDKYVAISALRHYFPKLFADYAGRKDHMPIRPGKPAPELPAPHRHDLDARLSRTRRPS